MRPYLAILKDSFREALASRVLWILVVLVTLILAGLAPFGLHEESATLLGQNEVKAPPDLIRAIVDASQAPEPSPGKHLWSLLSSDLQSDLQQTVAANDLNMYLRRSRRLTNELNEHIPERDFYNADAWKRTPQGAEAKALLERGVDKLSDNEVARLNRLSLDAAFPQLITPAGKTTARFVYASYPLETSIVFTQEEARQILDQALATLVALLAGTFGVLAAILVTSPIIPHTFESGAIDLLLSKPVNRSLLFLTKFLGGCSFVLLNTTYFLVGVYFIMGVRFGIWNPRLILCVPVFLFLFAIYYSVSALAGVVWKNAIVSVVMTILFWGVCFTVGTSKQLIELGFLNGTRIAAIVPAKDALIGRDRSSNVSVWDEQQQLWNPIFAGSGGPQRFPSFEMLVGPVYDAKADRLVALEGAGGRFGMSGASSKLVVGDRESGWTRVGGTQTPPGIQSLFLEPKGAILVVGPGGIYRFEGEATAANKPFKVFGLDIARKDVTARFVPAAAAGSLKWGAPFSAAQDPNTGRLAVYHTGKLDLVAADESGQYAVKQTVDFGTMKAAMVAIAGKTVLVALATGEVRVLDAETLAVRKSFDPFDKIEPQAVSADSSGKYFAVLSHDSRVWIYDAAADTPIEDDLRGQEDLSAVTFTDAGTVLAADRFDRVTEYELPSFAQKRTLSPSGDFLKRFYLYFLKPLYTVFPKPSQLDNMVSYLLTEKKTGSLSGEDDDLQGQRVVLEVWEPVISNSIFLALLLGVTCVYISRRDF